MSFELCHQTVKNIRSFKVCAQRPLMKMSQIRLTHNGPHFKNFWWKLRRLYESHFVQMNLSKHFFQVSQSCEEMLISCVYGGVEFNCTDIFVTVLTDEGLCCTFNAVNRKFIAKPQFKLASPITDGYSLISVKSWAFTVSAFEAEWILRNWFLRFQMFCRKIWCSKL